MTGGRRFVGEEKGAFGTVKRKQGVGRFVMSESRVGRAAESRGGWVRGRRRGSERRRRSRQRRQLRRPSSEVWYRLMMSLGRHFLWDWGHRSMAVRENIEKREGIPLRDLCCLCASVRSQCGSAGCGKREMARQSIPIQRY